MKIDVEMGVFDQWDRDNPDVITIRRIKGGPWYFYNSDGLAEVVYEKWQPETWSYDGDETVYDERTMTDRRA